MNNTKREKAREAPRLLERGFLSRILYPVYLYESRWTVDGFLRVLHFTVIFVV